MDNKVFTVPAKFSTKPGIDPITGLGKIFASIPYFKVVEERYNFVSFELDEISGYQNYNLLCTYLFNRDTIVGDYKFTVTKANGVPVYTFSHDVMLEHLSTLYTTLQGFSLVKPI